MNKVFISGNLGRDPEIRSANSGTKFASFSIAVKEREDTIWIDVTFAGKLADTIERYLKKGSKILVEGKWAVNSWEKDGQKISKSYVFGERFEFLDSAKKDSGGSQEFNHSDDLPF